MNSLITQYKYILNTGFMQRSGNSIKKTNLRSKRNKYDKIDSDKRRQLMNLVKKHNYSIKDASQMLNINYSTAKTILQLYKKVGRIDRLERKYLLSFPINSSELDSPSTSVQDDNSHNNVENPEEEH